MVQGFSPLTLGLANQSVSSLRTRIREGSAWRAELDNLIFCQPGRITQRFLDVFLLQIWVLGDNFLA